MRLSSFRNYWSQKTKEMRYCGISFSETSLCNILFGDLRKMAVRPVIADLLVKCVLLAELDPDLTLSTFSMLTSE